MHMNVYLCNAAICAHTPKELSTLRAHKHARVPNIENIIKRIKTDVITIRFICAYVYNSLTSIVMYHVALLLQPMRQ